jgi:sugar-specific transcriptional regulator TrmB
MDMLQPLGVSDEAEAVYVALAPIGAATTSHLMDLTHQRAGVVESLEELRRLGLATELSPGLWQALPLPKVAKALRAQRLSEVEMASAAAESLHSHILASSRSQTDELRIIIGREAMLAANREICASAQKEICMFDKPPYAEDHAGSEEAISEESSEWQALERGAKLRCIYHPGFDAERLKELTMFAAKGENSRTAAVPMKLILVDAQIAMIPSMRSYLSGHELTMSVVKYPTLVEALQWLFEAVWDTAVPIAAAALSDNDPRRQMLVSLLMAGSTDNAIANQLGINVRSVRRWISELMDQLGVTTRLQLGAALVRAESLGSQKSANITPNGGSENASIVDGGPQNPRIARPNGPKLNGSSATSNGTNGTNGTHARNGKRRPHPMPILPGT